VADEAVLNTVQEKEKNPKQIPLFFIYFIVIKDDKKRIKDTKS
jgi:hypothetical protein